MGLYVRIGDDENSFKFPLVEEGGPLSLEALQTRYPSAKGLVYTDGGGEKVVLPAVGGVIRPLGQWKPIVYHPLFPEGSTDGRESETIQSLTKLLLRPQPQLVLAPEKKLPTFDGVGDVHEFVTAMEDAFTHYNVPAAQQATFLLDRLRGGPKDEVKAIIKGDGSIGEVVDFLKSSYAEVIPVGELQRRFLERRQGTRESVREYAVDLERKFLSLTSRSPYLYAKPDALLSEQFIEGLEDTFLRNTLRDLYEVKQEMTFRDLRELAIKRERREEARSRSGTPSTAHVSSIKGQSSSLDSEVVEAVRAMTNEVIGAVREMIQLNRPRVDMQDKPPPSGSARRGPCFNCWAFGHFARECPQERRRRDTSAMYSEGSPPRMNEGTYPPYYYGDPSYPTGPLMSGPSVVEGQHYNYPGAWMPNQMPVGAERMEGQVPGPMERSPSPQAQHPSSVSGQAQNNGQRKREQNAVVGSVSKVSATTSDGKDEGFLSRAVGECYSVEAKFGPVPVNCLLDPGSQVTTVGESFFNSHLRPAGYKLKATPPSFALVSADGKAISYVGCFDTDVRVLGHCISSKTVLVLGEKEARRRGQSPVGVLGMNVLQDCWQDLIKGGNQRSLARIPWPTLDPVSDPTSYPQSSVKSGEGRQRDRKWTRPSILEPQSQVRMARDIAPRNAKAARETRKAPQVMNVYEKPLGVGPYAPVQRQVREGSRRADYRKNETQSEVSAPVGSARSYDEHPFPTESLRSPPEDAGKAGNRSPEPPGDEADDEGDGTFESEVDFSHVSSPFPIHVGEEGELETVPVVTDSAGLRRLSPRERRLMEAKRYPQLGRCDVPPKG